MNKKELIEQLKKNMPEGLSKLEIARYVYIELGKIKAFDERHYFGNKATKRKIYNLARQTEHNTDEVAEEKSIVCVSLSYLYRDILKEFNIDCKVILDEYDPDKHMYPIVYLGDGRTLVTDLQMDLHRIQTRSKTKNFKISNYPPNREFQITDDELKEIDKKIGYIQNDYKDADLDELAKEVEEMGATDALGYIFSSDKLYRNTNIKGYVEAMKFTYSALKRILPHYWQKKVYMVDCYKKQEDNSKKYTLCVFSQEKEEVKPYLYSLKEGRFLPVSIESLAKLQNDGLIIGRYHGQVGAGLLKKCVKNYSRSNHLEGKSDADDSKER